MQILLVQFVQEAPQYRAVRGCDVIIRYHSIHFFINMCEESERVVSSNPYLKHTSVSLSSKTLSIYFKIFMAFSLIWTKSGEF